MFVDLNDLKGLIVDLDSFQDDFDDNFIAISDKIKILFYSANNPQRLDVVSTLCQNSEIYEDDPLSGLFVSKRKLHQILELGDLHSYEVAYFTSNKNNIIRLQVAPISTILFTDEDDKLDDRTDYQADYSVHSFDDLEKIISGENVGYYAEAWSARPNRFSSNQRHICDVIEKEKQIGENKASIVIGGRYFNANDPRSITHQLSKRILKNKNEDSSQNDVFKVIFETLLMRYIETKVKKVELVTRIPPKPSQTYDRFKDVLDYIGSKNPQIIVSEDALRCIKDYQSQKSLNQAERAENIKGAFQAGVNVQGKHVVIIDDVLTSGETSKEAIQTLYDAGASYVTLLVLGVNQKGDIFRSRLYHRLECECGGEYALRFSGAGDAFYGCTNYYPANCRNSLNYIDGTRRYNIANCIQAEGVEEDVLEF